MNSRSIITLWEKLYHIDTLIKTKGIKLSYKKLKYTLLVYAVTVASFHTFYVLFIACIQTYKNIWFSATIYFTLNLSMSGFVCTSCSFHGFFLVIKHMFSKILKHMEDCLLRNDGCDSKTKSNVILQTAILHQDLCEVARLANDVTSVQILASFTVIFSLITLQIYSIVTSCNMGNADYNFVISSVLCVFSLLQERISLGIVSHQCMRMIPKTKQLLSKVMHLYVHDHKICEEINSFNLQILHDQFEITAGNFFPIDLPIYLTGGGTIITYILLFLQTDPFLDIYQNMKDVVGAY